MYIILGYNIDLSLCMLLSVKGDAGFENQDILLSDAVFEVLNVYSV
jgi:hypothetical protein